MSIVSKSFRWGILGTAVISNKFVLAVGKSETSVVSAVASRSLDKARKWAEERGIPKAYGSYEELLMDPEIDAIYVPLPTSMKAEWSIKAAEKGKHVLVEKPFASEADVKSIIAACVKNNVLFMDGTMWVHHIRAEKVQEVLRSGAIGDLKRISSAFTFKLTDATNIRLQKDLEPLGSLGDVGWYNVRATLWAVDYKLPTEVACFSDFDSDVPTDLHAVLWFPGGITASFDNSFGLAIRQWVELRGTKGALRINDCFLPFTADLALFAARERNLEAEFTVTDGAGVEQAVTLGSCIQEVQMIDDFAREARAGKRDERYVTEPLRTQRVLDALYESARKGGVKVAVPQD